MNPRLLGFVFRSLRASFRGEKMTHVLTLMTVCVSLALVGGVFLVQHNLIAWADAWAGETAVAIFLDGKTKPEKRREISDFVEKQAGLADLTWTPPDRSSRELAEILGLSNAERLQDFAPWIIEARKTAETNDAVLDKLAANPHVLFIDRGVVLAEKLKRLSESLRTGGIALSILLLMAAFLVVSNTVGLALNARRDEIEIMDLVGTPLGWIYTAYIAEGVILGVVGAGIAVILLGFATDIAAEVLRGFGAPALTGFPTSGVQALLAIGGSIGAFGSAISIRRFLHRDQKP